MTSIHLGLGKALFAFAATTPAAVTQLDGVLGEQVRRLKSFAERQ